MNGKLIGAFFGGMTIGVAAGVVAASKILDKKYFDKYDEKVKELENYYDRVGEYDREIDEDLEREEKTEKKEETGALSPEQRREIREKLLRNERKTTEYASYYAKKKEKKADLAEMEHPEDDSEEENEEKLSEEDLESLRRSEEYEKNRFREPRLISSEAIGELDTSWDEVTLLYYALDGTVATEDDTEIEDYERLIGDCLTKYDFENNDEMVIYVQNFEFSTVYEVQKVYAKFEGM